MTAAVERPAGRMAGPARPAGARRAGRGTGTPTVDPRIIRAALAYSRSHTLLATGARFKVSGRQVQRWRARAAAAAAAGGTWPSDADVAAWVERAPQREADRARLHRWTVRRAQAGGPLFVSSLGTTRRMRALAALGWRYSDLAVELRVVESRVGHLTVRPNRVVHRDTAAAVATVYERLSMTFGPSEVTRTRAAARGWAPPMFWDDDTIDDPAGRPRRSGPTDSAALDDIAIARAMRGERVPLRRAERAEASRRLTAAGRSAAEIAELLDTSERAVQRHRSSTPDTSRRTA
ncbi:hypothetical protein [Blastococcus xanthinilyticus]|uniref:Homeodomain-like domain-containing protein n=1 Tax=Blastococcus xanthinilyticus TaxID=1564164 RepID=A0A5S5CNN8_9ACTN|nr:hypothetical protein [Blastococcus xanthinilyticus]TYP82041.1 hypothetical protein BD833_12025 [Blastococcus xanthinilyticus]